MMKYRLVKKKGRGGDNMNAYAIKSDTPYVTKSALARTPASEDNRKIVEFINAHDFSFNIDEKGKLISVVTEKRK